MVVSSGYHGDVEGKIEAMRGIIEELRSRCKEGSLPGEDGCEEPLERLSRALAELEATHRSFHERWQEEHAGIHEASEEELLRAREQTAVLGEANKALREENEDRRKAEESERDSEILIREVLQALPIGVWVTDREGNMIMSNPAGHDLWGGARLVGMDGYGEYKGWWADTGNPIAPEEWAAARAVKEGKTSFNELIEIERFDGKRRIILNSAVPIYDAQNEIKGAVAVNQDITELRQVQEALRLERERLFSLLDNLPAFVYLQASDCSIRFANRYFREHFGDPTGKNCMDLLHNHRGSFQECPAYEVFISGKPQKWELWCPVDGRAYQIYDYPFTDIDGSALVLELGIDITERKQAEDSLRVSERSFRELVENALTAIAITQNERIIYRNREHERLLGPIESSFDINQLKHIHPEDRERAKCLYNELLSGRKPLIDTVLRVYPFAGIGKATDLKWVHFRATPIEYEGKEALLINMMDQTRIKELERLVSLQDRMSALGRISAGIAHEIRNPLGGLNLYLGVLRDLLKGLDLPQEERVEKLYEIIDRIGSASNRIEAVIRRVMDFSKPSSVKMSLIDLNQCIEDSLKLAAVTLRKSEVSVETDLDPNMPHCYADPQLMQHVLLNLITNAIEAMRHTEGPKRVEISSRAVAGNAVMMVSDSGPGMPEELRSRILDPFFSTKTEGMGIGLSICHRIITDHNGSIEVSTSKWGGCLFRIAFPLKQGTCSI